MDSQQDQRAGQLSKAEKRLSHQTTNRDPRTFFGLAQPLSASEFAMVAAVEAINSQPDQQPSEETQPSENRQTAHQQHAEEHTQHGGDNPAGSPEAAMPVRILVPQNDDA